MYKRSQLRSAIFLDRDGVLNEAVVFEGRPYPPKNLGAMRLLPGVREACSALKHAGFLLVAVTNQPDIARKTALQTDVEAINQKLKVELELHDIRVCPHDDMDLCHCRKPKPGLLLDASREMSIDLRSSFMVGDRWRDIEAGCNAGCRTVFIDYGYAEKRPTRYDYICRSLADIAATLIENAPRARIGRS